MALPDPVPGLVIRYAYLWRSEHLRGQEEGAKDRPCAIVLSTAMERNERIVTVLPITHSRPADLRLAMEIPTKTKLRLGLDHERSWIVLTEANRFAWPVPDLRPLMPGDAGSVAYGVLPFRLFEMIRERFLHALKDRRVAPVPRTE